MRALRRVSCTVASLAFFLSMGAFVVQAQTTPDTDTGPRKHRAESEKPAREESALEPNAPVPFSYRPPPRGAPSRRASGGSRAIDLRTIELTVLAPRSTGLTSQASPTLYWYASRPIEQPVSVFVSTPGVPDPILRVRLDDGIPSGIRSISLKEKNVELEVGVDYEWAVVVLLDADQPSGNVITMGGIRRVEAPASLQSAVPNSSDLDDAAFYAESGLWYDALDALAAGIEREPTLRDARAWLLEQEGLMAAAAHDRGVRR